MNEYKASAQVKTIVKGSNIIGCLQAQVFKDGNSFLVIEPTIDESEASETAIFLAEALNNRKK